jgi:hypothetical protein
MDRRAFVAGAFTCGLLSHAQAAGTHVVDLRGSLNEGSARVLDKRIKDYPSAAFELDMIISPGESPDYTVRPERGGPLTIQLRRASLTFNRGDWSYGPAGRLVVKGAFMLAVDRADSTPAITAYVMERLTAPPRNVDRRTFSTLQ